MSVAWAMEKEGDKCFTVQNLHARLGEHRDKEAIGPKFVN